MANGKPCLADSARKIPLSLIENADLAELLDEAISNIHAEITDYEVDEELTEEDNSIPADPEVRNFSYTVVDDKIYYRENSE